MLSKRLTIATLLNNCPVLRPSFDRITYLLPYSLQLKAEGSAALSGRAYFMKRGQLLIKAAIKAAIEASIPHVQK